MAQTYLKALGIAAAFLLAGSTTTMAQTVHVEQDPETPGTHNACWGDIASQTAQLDTPDGTSGGAFGQHSRATVAANLNGGFTSDGNLFGITFNVKDPDGNAGRLGVGNATADVDGFHQVHPGDGGQGVHAENNAALAAILDPVTGQSASGPSGLGCDLP